MSEELEHNNTAIVEVMQRRAVIFGEEVINNMLDYMGPLETINFLMFWVQEINNEMILDNNEINE